jgi:hypothetical protein
MSFTVREGIWAVLRTGLEGDAESVADLLERRARKRRG